MSAPLPAPTLLQTWAQVKLRLNAYVNQPKFVDALAELSEWYWEAACEELSDQAASVLRALPVARLNFDSLCMFDMDAGSDQSAAEHLLSFGKLGGMELEVLRKLVHARMRIVRLQPAGSLGLHKAEDLNSGKTFFVASDAMTKEWTEPVEVLTRLLVFPGIALSAGPVFALPSERNDPLRREAEDLVNHMMHPRMPDCRSVRERGLVDFSHQWAEHWLHTNNPQILPAPPFTLLRGA